MKKINLSSVEIPIQQILELRALVATREILARDLKIKDHKKIYKKMLRLFSNETEHELAAWFKHHILQRHKIPRT